MAVGGVWSSGAGRADHKLDYPKMQTEKEGCGLIFASGEAQTLICGVLVLGLIIGALAGRWLK